MKATELIKPEEIRVGNYLKHSEDEVIGKIDSIYGEEVFISEWHLGTTPLKECEPIELTEELLLRAGMEKDEAMFKMKHEEYEIKIMFYDCWRLFIDSQFESACLTGYWNFHEFQNILKDLTGKELTLN